MSTKLEEVSKQMQSEEMLELAESSEILTQVNSEEVEITLDFFETYFLPYIIYEVEHTDEYNMIFNYNYYKIAKKYSVSIVVIGDNNEVLYKLPPLVSDVNLDKLSNVAFSKIVSVFTNVAESNESMANKMLGKALNEVGTLIETKSNVYEQSLQAIFQDYKHRLKDSFLSDKIKEHYIDESTPNVIPEVDDEDFLDYS